MNEIIEAAKLMDAINQELANRVESITKERDQLRAELALHRDQNEREIYKLRAEVEKLKSNEPYKTMSEIMVKTSAERDQWREVASKLYKELYDTHIATWNKEKYCIQCDCDPAKHEETCIVGNALAAYEKLKGETK